ncbi:BRO-N domain-containing protein [Clostridium nigeriense]|uniref:BRO-N domain-containing protein n=1 Tax=Clostridium nigeriense TaxID=1805470 RepID=UPI003D333620
MNNQLQIFENEEFGEIRGLEINGDSWLVGKDITDRLGYSNSRKALKDHVDEEDKGVTKCDTLGGKQNLVVINESGLYSLILRSNMPKAKKFKRWVTSEVLPQIRKTGSYQSQQNQINEFKGQLTTLVNDIFEDKLSEIKEYYKIKSKSKSDISSYIKKRLGILRADDEYEQVKARVFLLLGISKWEDLDIDSYKRILPIIDESIRIIKLDRPQQIGMWD